MTSFFGVVFDGVAYGSLLFLISVGLSITLGLMNFVHLAHGVFAMLGGYIAVTLMSAMGVSYWVALPLAFIATAMVGAVFERLLYRYFYEAGPLDQTLLCIGVVLMSMATATYIWGPQQQAVTLPETLKGNIEFAGLELGRFRIFVIAVVAVITLALTGLIEKTVFGAQVRASVDNRQAAAGLGIGVDVLFTLCFALGTGLAGLGGALAADVIGLDPAFPIKYMVYFLLVVAVGGAGSIKGPLIAAIFLGLCDVAGKYYLPQVSAFAIYVVMVIMLVLFPAGLYGRRA
jgi:branched-chain amino acid transport system permease protein